MRKPVPAGARRQAPAPAPAPVRWQQRSALLPAAKASAAPRGPDVPSALNPDLFLPFPTLLAAVAALLLLALALALAAPLLVRCPVVPAPPGSAARRRWQRRRRAAGARPERRCAAERVQLHPACLHEREARCRRGEVRAAAAPLQRSQSHAWDRHS
jgi:hypothetical protein